VHEPEPRCLEEGHALVAATPGASVAGADHERARHRTTLVEQLIQMLDRMSPISVRDGESIEVLSHSVLEGGLAQGAGAELARRMMEADFEGMSLREGSWSFPEIAIGAIEHDDDFLDRLGGALGQAIEELAKRVWIEATEEKERAAGGVTRIRRYRGRGRGFSACRRHCH